jgi:hypothetical protein
VRTLATLGNDPCTTKTDNAIRLTAPLSSEYAISMVTCRTKIRARHGKSKLSAIVCLDDDRNRILLVYNIRLTLIILTDNVILATIPTLILILNMGLKPVMLILSPRWIVGSMGPLQQDEAQ